jgi:vitamin-K-epoxide reductase (warfarin-sensitive)
MILSIVILAGIGLGLSLYAYYVERNLDKNPNYKAACDLSDTVSCSKVIRSPYATLFFVSNALLGAVYYIVLGLLALINQTTLVLVMTALGFLASLGLAYILYAKIKSLCLICTSIYVVNVLLLLAALRIV